MKCYNVIAFNASCGIIEAIPNTINLDVLRRRDSQYITLFDFYKSYILSTQLISITFNNAIENFVISLATYSRICSIVSIKDRHNGNISLDTEGSLIHLILIIIIIIII